MWCTIVRIIIRINNNMVDMLICYTSKIYQQKPNTGVINLQE